LILLSDVILKTLSLVTHPESIPVPDKNLVTSRAQKYEPSIQLTDKQQPQEQYPTAFAGKMPALPAPGAPASRRPTGNVGLGPTSRRRSTSPFARPASGDLNGVFLDTNC